MIIRIFCSFDSDEKFAASVIFQEEIFLTEVVNFRLMALKLSLSLLVFILQQSFETKVFLSLILLWIYQSLVRIVKPYENPFFNTFQVILINMLIFNMVLTHYLIEPINGLVLVKISVIAAIIDNSGLLLFMLWKILALSYLNMLACIK